MSDAEHECCGAVVPGEAVFLKRERKCMLALVESFDGRNYGLKMRNGQGQWQTCNVGVDDNDGWVNKALPMCCVCLDSKANVCLSCRCTAPSICAKCAVRIRTCPQCRDHVHGSPHCQVVLDREQQGLCKESDRTFRTRILLDRFPRIHAMEPPYSSGRVQIFIRTLLGKTTILNVKLEWTVRTIKALYLAREATPIDQQRLVFRGHQLDDARTLLDYGIQKESLVHLILRLSGD